MANPLAKLGLTKTTWDHLSDSNRTLEEQGPDKPRPGRRRAGRARDHPLYGGTSKGVSKASTSTRAGGISKVQTRPLDVPRRPLVLVNGAGGCSFNAEGTASRPLGAAPAPAPSFALPASCAGKVTGEQHQAGAAAGRYSIAAATATAATRATVSAHQAAALHPHRPSRLHQRTGPQDPEPPSPAASAGSSPSSSSQGQQPQQAALEEAATPPQLAAPAGFGAAVSSGVGGDCGRSLDTLSDLFTRSLSLSRRAAGGNTAAAGAAVGAAEGRGAGGGGGSHPAAGAVAATPAGNDDGGECGSCSPTPVQHHFGSVGCSAFLAVGRVTDTPRQPGSSIPATGGAFGVGGGSRPCSMSEGTPAACASRHDTACSKEAEVLSPCQPSQLHYLFSPRGDPAASPGMTGSISSGDDDDSGGLRIALDQDASSSDSATASVRSSPRRPLASAAPSAGRHVLGELPVALRPSVVSPRQLGTGSGPGQGGGSGNDGGQRSPSTSYNHQARPAAVAMCEQVQAPSRESLAWDVEEAACRGRQPAASPHAQQRQEQRQEQQWLGVEAATSRPVEVQQWHSHAGQRKEAGEGEEGHQEEGRKQQQEQGEQHEWEDVQDSMEQLPLVSTLLPDTAAAAPSPPPPSPQPLSLVGGLEAEARGARRSRAALDVASPAARNRALSPFVPAARADWSEAEAMATDPPCCPERRRAALLPPALSPLCSLGRRSFHGMEEGEEEEGPARLPAAMADTAARSGPPVAVDGGSAGGSLAADAAAAAEEVAAAEPAGLAGREAYHQQQQQQHCAAAAAAAAAVAAAAAADTAPNPADGWGEEEGGCSFPAAGLCSVQGLSPWDPMERPAGRVVELGGRPVGGASEATGQLRLEDVPEEEDDGRASHFVSSCPAPLTSAYRALTWQRDAMEYADFCNREGRPPQLYQLQQQRHHKRPAEPADLASGRRSAPVRPAEGSVPLADTYLQLLSKLNSSGEVVGTRPAAAPAAITAAAAPIAQAQQQQRRQAPLTAEQYTALVRGDPLPPPPQQLQLQHQEPLPPAPPQQQQWQLPIQTASGLGPMRPPPSTPPPAAGPLAGFADTTSGPHGPDCHAPGPRLERTAGGAAADTCQPAAVSSAGSCFDPPAAAADGGAAAAPAPTSPGRAAAAAAAGGAGQRGQHEQEGLAAGPGAGDDGVPQQQQQVHPPQPQGVVHGGGAGTAGDEPLPIGREFVRVFCEERPSKDRGGGGGGGSNGSGYTRQFVASSYPALLRRYRTLPAGARHMYEVIREGRPCHLYFDIEFNTQANPGLDGGKLVDLLLNLVAAQMRQLFGLELQQGWVWELDSTTSSKFSRHLVLRIPGVAFATNQDAGALVARILCMPAASALRVAKEAKRLAEGGKGTQPARHAGACQQQHQGRLQQQQQQQQSVQQQQQQQQLPLGQQQQQQQQSGQQQQQQQQQSGQQQQQQQPDHQHHQQQQDLTSAVDGSVYSRNRHFRLPFSSKGGKAAVLQPSPRFALAAGVAYTQEQVLLRCMVCNVEPGAQLLQVDPPRGAPAGLVGGLKLKLMPNVRGGGPSSGPGGGEEIVSYIKGRVCDVKVCWKVDDQDAPADHRQMRDLGDLARRAIPFIEAAATERAGGLPAHVRTMAACGYQGSVAYSLIGAGSHFCGNIGRHHRSNHVFYVANFARGWYVQKCHDRDCAAFRSEAAPLPPHLILPAPAEPRDGSGGGGGGGPSRSGGGSAALKSALSGVANGSGSSGGVEDSSSREADTGAGVLQAAAASSGERLG